MKKIFNIILLALFCTSFAQAQGGKTFEFAYEGQTLKYEVANGNEAMVSKPRIAKISGDVKIPESVTFEGKKYTVTSIGVNAFRSCTGLTSVIIPNSVAAIGEAAFEECKGLTSVTIPNSVTKIGVEAFAYCTGLTILTVENATPPDVGGDAFEGVSDLIMEDGQTPDVGGGVFEEVSENITIYVPAESVEKYKTARVWSEYADKIKAIENKF